MKKNLSEITIIKKLAQLSGWTFEKNSLKKSYVFKDFREAITFILRISYEAEELNHHPEIFNCFNRVEIILNTHEAGNKVTQIDFDLAKAMDSIS